MTVRKTSRIACSLTSTYANVNGFLPGRDIDEGQEIQYVTDRQVLWNIKVRKRSFG